MKINKEKCTSVNTNSIHEQKKKINKYRKYKYY